MPRPSRFTYPTSSSSAAFTLEPALHPLWKYIAEVNARRRLQSRVESQIEERLRELSVDAQLEDEFFSERSESDFLQFVQLAGVTKRPSIFLMDNGNIRALWRDADGQEVGLQFLGSGQVQFVIFSQRENPRMMMRIYGVDSLVEIRARIARDRVDALLVG